MEATRGRLKTELAGTGLDTSIFSDQEIEAALEAVQGDYRLALAVMCREDPTLPVDVCSPAGRALILLHHPAGDVRLEATKALVSEGERHAETIVRVALHDFAVDVQSYAIDSLKTVAQAAAPLAGAFVEMLSEDFSREKGLRALGNLGRTVTEHAGAVVPLLAHPPLDEEASTDEMAARIRNEFKVRKLALATLVSMGAVRTNAAAVVAMLTHVARNIEILQGSSLEEHPREVYRRDEWSLQLEVVRLIDQESLHHELAPEHDTLLLQLQHQLPNGGLGFGPAKRRIGAVVRKARAVRGDVSTLEHIRTLTAGDAPTACVFDSLKWLGKRRQLQPEHVSLVLGRSSDDELDRLMPALNSFYLRPAIIWPVLEELKRRLEELDASGMVAESAERSGWLQRSMLRQSTLHMLTAKCDIWRARRLAFVLSCRISTIAMVKDLAVAITNQI